MWDSTLAQSRRWVLSCHREVHPLFSGLFIVHWATWAQTEIHYSQDWGLINNCQHQDAGREVQLRITVIIFNKWLQLCVHSLRGTAVCLSVYQFVQSWYWTIVQLLLFNWKYGKLEILGSWLLSMTTCLHGQNWCWFDLVINGNCVPYFSKLF